MDAESSITVLFLKSNVIVSRRTTSGSEKKCEREWKKLKAGVKKNINKENIWFGSTLLGNTGKFERMRLFLTIIHVQKV